VKPVPAGHRPWVEAGPPPGTRKTGPPAWAILVAVIVAAVVSACSAMIVMGSILPAKAPHGGSLVGEPGKVEVEVTGQCEKRVMGAYGVLASITAHNSGPVEAVGRLWVRWPQTGAESLSFGKDFTLPPNATETFYVDQEVHPPEHWYRLRTCEYGWTDA
jgi:hypothetical protein